MYSSLTKQKNTHMASLKQALLFVCAECEHLTKNSLTTTPQQKHLLIDKMLHCTLNPNGCEKKKKKTGLKGMHVYMKERHTDSQL
jgi:hypothetical protein